MSTNYFKDRIKKDLEADLESREIALEKWNEVKFLYKKDGKPFANLKMGFDGATYDYDRHDDMKEMPKLTISYTTKLGVYHRDVVHCYKCETNNWKIFSMEEIIQAVQEHKEYLRNEIAELQYKLIKFETMFDELDKALDGVKEVTTKYKLDAYGDVEKYIMDYIRYN